MSRSVLLKLEEGWSTKDHAQYVRLLLNANVRAQDIKQIDLHGQAGACIVTVSCPAVRDQIIANGLSFNGQPVKLSTSAGDVVSVHLFGIEDNLSLPAITKAMERFGSVVGAVTRDTKTVDGCTFRPQLHYGARLTATARLCRLPRELYGTTETWGLAVEKRRRRTLTPGQSRNACREVCREGDESCFQGCCCFWAPGNILLVVACMCCACCINSPKNGLL